MIAFQIQSGLCWRTQDIPSSIGSCQCCCTLSLRINLNDTISNYYNLLFRFTMLSTSIPKVCAFNIVLLQMGQNWSIRIIWSHLKMLLITWIILKHTISFYGRFSDLLCELFALLSNFHILFIPCPQVHQLLIWANTMPIVVNALINHNKLEILQST